MWKLALHSVSYAGVWPGQARLTLEEFVDQAADLGYSGLMLMAKRTHASLLDLPDARRKELLARMGDRGLRLAAIAAYTDFTAASGRADVPLQEMQILYVRECARLARDLGGDIVRIFTGYECAELSPAQAWDRCVHAVQECGRQAAEFGVRLAVQNHHDVAVHYRAMHDFLTEVGLENVGAGYDAWAPTLQGQSGHALAEGVRHLRRFLIQTIVADYVRRPRYRYNPGLTNYSPDQEEIKAVPMGEGIIDYTTFFDTLREVGYDGWVTYEMCSSLRGGGALENLDLYARRFCEWMAGH